MLLSRTVKGYIHVQMLLSRKKRRVLGGSFFMVITHNLNQVWIPD